MPDCQTNSGPPVVAIPCRIGDLPNTVNALLDTAAEWPVLNSGIARALGYDAKSEGLALTMSTRHGRKEGVVVQIRVCFPASEGGDLDMDASWFVCDEWDHPPVIGWRGCLQWIRFALNPDENAFYFAQTLGLNPE